MLHIITSPPPRVLGLKVADAVGVPLSESNGDISGVPMGVVCRLLADDILRSDTPFDLMHVSTSSGRGRGGMDADWAAWGWS